MAAFVLVHPAWFGGWSWRKVVPLLIEAGHSVHTPTLTGLGERSHLATPKIGLGTHIDDVVQVLEFEDLHDVILVGSSSSGAVVTGVADRVPERIAKGVYLDAFVPADGQCVVDLIPAERQAPRDELTESEGDGWLVPRFSPQPWEEFVPVAWGVTDEEDLRWIIDRLRPTPVNHFREPVRLRSSGSEGIRRVYIRSDWPNGTFDRHAAEASSSPDWEVRELATPHLPQLTHPNELAALLLDLAR